MASSPNAWSAEVQSRESQSNSHAEAARPSAVSPRLWLWPNLLSLDAPLVAVLWQVLFARCFGIRIPAASAAALGLAVWLIYAGDRMADGLRYRPGRSETPRHRFYRINRGRIIPWFAIASGVVAWLSLTSLAPDLLRNYAILSAATAAYFAVVHLAPEGVRRHWPKELAVALLFAAGTCMAAFTAMDGHHIRLVASCLLFAAVVWINTAGIECWEQAPKRAARLQLGPITGLLGFHLEGAALLLSAVAALALLTAASAHALYAAIAISALSLAMLDAMRRRLSPDSLRVLADVAMLSPLLFLPFLLMR